MTLEITALKEVFSEKQVNILGKCYLSLVDQMVQAMN
eukprot:CAMPEP_0116877876 /NCGR_PEP_ID=MMETSP0463-20121206/9621_1 /TAXON_ID=181622 /ORGANISM="Strombidinopsis sp, Strain SopsisLIS2011" /LENGTH=36 /DNA_ID= /DNA_START= /DNA_END= /DNA_ORIENTATION=